MSWDDLIQRKGDQDKAMQRLFSTWSIWLYQDLFPSSRERRLEGGEQRRDKVDSWWLLLTQKVTFLHRVSISQSSFFGEEIRDNVDDDEIHHDYDSGESEDEEKEEKKKVARLVRELAEKIAFPISSSPTSVSSSASFRSVKYKFDPCSPSVHSLVKRLLYLQPWWSSSDGNAILTLSLHYALLQQDYRLLQSLLLVFFPNDGRDVALYDDSYFHETSCHMILQGVCSLFTRKNEFTQDAEEADIRFTTMKYDDLMRIIVQILTSMQARGIPLQKQVRSQLLQAVQKRQTTRAASADQKQQNLVNHATDTDNNTDDGLWVALSEVIAAYPDVKNLPNRTDISPQHNSDCASPVELIQNYLAFREEDLLRCLVRASSAYKYLTQSADQLDQQLPSSKYQNSGQFVNKNLLKKHRRNGEQTHPKVTISSSSPSPPLITI